MMSSTNKLNVTTYISYILLKEINKTSLCNPFDVYEFILKFLKRILNAKVFKANLIHSKKKLANITCVTNNLIILRAEIFVKK